MLAAELVIHPCSPGERDEIPTACINQRGVMLFNAHFVKMLTTPQLMTLVAHEALHVALEFWTRFLGAVLEIANDAHDYAINPILEGSGLTPIDGWLFDYEFLKLSAEEIYSILLARQHLGRHFMKFSKTSPWNAARALRSSSSPIAP